MLKTFRKTFLVLSTFFLLFNSLISIPTRFVIAQTDLPEINFFYSQTCPHCAEQKEFHEYLLEKYPNLIINSYDIASFKTAPILKNFAEKYGAEKYLGLVPLTFIGESFFLGFDTAETTGAQIELALIKNNPILMEQAEFCDENKNQLCIVENQNTNVSSHIADNNYTTINDLSRLSFLGIKAEDLSLPILSIVLGFLDGFNVCSIGALILILSLALTFKSRRDIFILGGVFLLITGITYASLIFVWFSIFQLLAPFVRVMEIIIGLIGIVGAVIFFRQYFRFKKYGPACEFSNLPIINNLANRIKQLFSDRKNIWLMISAVILFAFVVTVIEFPCSAVIPVALAAILTNAGTGLLATSIYLGLFMIFYLLDEIIVFVIGVITLKIWFSNSGLASKLVLIQALLFAIIGIFYFSRLFL